MSKSSKHLLFIHVTEKPDQRVYSALVSLHTKTVVACVCVCQDPETGVVPPEPLEQFFRNLVLYAGEYLVVSTQPERDYGWLCERMWQYALRKRTPPSINLWRGRTFETWEVFVMGAEQTTGVLAGRGSAPFLDSDPGECIGHFVVFL
jgi:hypothetical protein